MTHAPQLRRLLVVLVVLVASACQIRTEVTLDVEEDGSGVVGVAVALDDAAVQEVPGLEQELRLDDLEAASWTVSGPTIEADGLTWIRVSKPFGTPAEAGPARVAAMRQGRAWMDGQARLAAEAAGRRLGVG